MLSSSSCFNFMNAINPFFCFKTQNLDDNYPLQKTDKIHLGEIGQALSLNQIKIISYKISNLEERISSLINKLNNILKASPSEDSPSSIASSYSSTQPADNFQQKISLLRTQLIDLGCAITAQMVENMLGITPEKAGKSSAYDSENNEWQYKITTLDNFLSFLETQAERLENPRFLSEKSMEIDIYSFFQKVSINEASHPFTFTLNIRLAILNEKHADLVNKIKSTQTLVTASDHLDVISYDMIPEEDKITRQISETEEKIQNSARKIKRAEIKIKREEIKRIGQVISFSLGA